MRNQFLKKSFQQKEQIQVYEHKLTFGSESAAEMEVVTQKGDFSSQDVPDS